MYRCTSPHSCYLGNEKISFPLTVDYCEFEARYSEDNESLAFEFEDLFTKDKPKTIRQKDNYYIFHKKDRHFHISQRYIKGKMIQTVRFEFLSAIINGKPIVFEEILEVSAFVEEDALFTKYNKILQQHNCTWPSPWDNKDYPSYTIQLMIQNEKSKLNKIKKERKPKTYNKISSYHPTYFKDIIKYSSSNLQIQNKVPMLRSISSDPIKIGEEEFKSLSMLTKPMDIVNEKICLMIKHINSFVWLKNKEDLIKFINELVHSNYTENDLVVEPCKFNPILGDNTHSVVIHSVGLIGFINRLI